MVADPVPSFSLKTENGGLAVPLIAAGVEVPPNTVEEPKVFVVFGFEEKRPPPG